MHPRGKIILQIQLYPIRLTAFALVVSSLVAGCSKASSNPPPATPPTKRIFITTLAYSGDLGGLSGGDEKCMNHAAGGGLDGTWKAWLSDATTDAIDRIADVGPWYLVDRSTKIFNTKANLTTQPVEPIWKDENGNSINANGILVWTGTVTGGTKAENTCSSWSSTSTLGRNGEAAMPNNTSALAVWVSVSDQGCNLNMHLYCIEL